MKMHLPAIAAGLLFALTARADTLSLTFSQPDQEVSTSTIVTYAGTITNNTAGVPLYLNGDAFTLAGPYILDDSSFLNAPQTLAVSESYTGTLFEVEIPDPSSLGTYGGYFTLLGGPDGSSQELLATEPFSLTVASPATPTPEPSSLLLLCTGALILVAPLSGLRGRSEAMRVPACRSEVLADSSTGT